MERSRLTLGSTEPRSTGLARTLPHGPMPFLAQGTGGSGVAVRDRAHALTECCGLRVVRSRRLGPLMASALRAFAWRSPPGLAPGPPSTRPRRALYAKHAGP